MFKIHPFIIGIFKFNFPSARPRKKDYLVLCTSIHSASGNIVRQHYSATTVHISSDMWKHHQIRWNFPTLQTLSNLFPQLLDKKSQKVKMEEQVNHNSHYLTDHFVPEETETSNWQTKIAIAWMKTCKKTHQNPNSPKPSNFYLFSLEMIKSILPWIMQLSMGP